MEGEKGEGGSVEQSRVSAPRQRDEEATAQFSRDDGRRLGGGGSFFREVKSRKLPKMLFSHPEKKKLRDLTNQERKEPPKMTS